MKKKILFILVVLALLVSALPITAYAEGKNDIVILYENDVHCEIDGYSALSAMKKELLEEYAYVGVVSSGDYLQGGSIGSISKGEYIVRLMNLVGYDAIALGNHEFDYGLERLFELSDMLNTKPVCANFKKIGEGECFAPYSIVAYGDVKIAYIGLTTPDTPEKTSFPTQFVDENQNPLYTFSKDDMARVLQENIDKARTEGADYVIALSHIGDKEEYNVAHIVAQITGLDIVLDAHSHSVIESDALMDKNGNEVVYTSTGTEFANIGKLIISEKGITTELISLDGYTETDPIIDLAIEQIMTEYNAVGNKKIAECDYDLITHDSQGNRVIRIRETNLGNLISDAFREVLGADIAYFNGGAIRSSIEKGEITYNDLLNVLPFNNNGVVVEVSGQTIVDMLELSIAKWPEENANFPHVSGLMFCVNTMADEGAKVYNVHIMNRETGSYEELALDEMYTVASSSFILLECGDGMTMFEGAEVVSDTGILDIEIVEKYLTENLGGVLDESYARVSLHITYTEGYLDNPYAEDGGHAIVIGVVGLILAVATIVTVLIIRKKRKG